MALLSNVKENNALDAALLPHEKAGRRAPLSAQELILTARRIMGDRVDETEVKSWLGQRRSVEFALGTTQLVSHQRHVCGFEVYQGWASARDRDM